MKNKKVIIWSKSIDDFIFGKKNFGGGITVQMYFWSKVFLKKGWNVYSITKNKKKCIEGINFIKIPTFNGLGIITEFLMVFYYMIIIKPNL